MGAFTLILLRIFIGVWMDESKVTYTAEAHEPEPKVILIGTYIDWTPKKIEEYIRSAFHEDPETTVAVAKAESWLNPNAVNPEAHEGCISSQGLMQIACVHYDGDPSDLQDVRLNIETARRIWEAQGWAPWSVCTNGTVDCGL